MEATLEKKKRRRTPEQMLARNAHDRKRAAEKRLFAQTPADMSPVDDSTVDAIRRELIVAGQKIARSDALTPDPILAAELEEIVEEVDEAIGSFAIEVVDLKAMAEQRIADSLRGDRELAEGIGADERLAEREVGWEFAAPLETPVPEPIPEPTPKMLKEVARVDALFERVREVAASKPTPKVEQHVFDNQRGTFDGLCVKCGTEYKVGLNSVHKHGKKAIAPAKSANAPEEPKPPRPREVYPDAKEREVRAGERWYVDTSSSQPLAQRILRRIAADAYTFNVRVLNGNGDPVPLNLDMIEKAYKAFGKELTARGRM